MKKLKILYDYSPACKKEKTGIPLFVNHLYDELSKMDTIDIRKTFCVSSVIPIKPWKFYRIFEHIIYHNIYLPLKLRFGHYDIYIENNYMFIPIFKPTNTVIVNIVYDIGLMLFDTIQTQKHTNNWRNKFPISIQNSDILITISKSSQKDIENYLLKINRKIPVNFIYADIDTVQPCKNATILQKFKIHYDYFLFLGTLEPRKNPLKLLEAFHLFKEENNTNIKLVYAGKKGWLYDDVVAYIDKHTLHDDVIFTGYVSQKEKACLLQHCKAFVFLSLYEGFGIPPLEALKFNIPVLVSDLPVFHELFEESVMFVDPEDVEQTANALKTIMINPPTIDKKIFTKFSWEKSASKLVKILESKVKNK